jgi:hypothetical protein
MSSLTSDPVGLEHYRNAVLGSSFLPIRPQACTVRVHWGKERGLSSKVWTHLLQPVFLVVQQQPDQSGSIQRGSRFLPRARLIRSSKRRRGQEVSSKLAISSDTGSRHETSKEGSEWRKRRTRYPELQCMIGPQRLWSPCWSIPNCRKTLPNPLGEKVLRGWLLFPWKGLVGMGSFCPLCKSLNMTITIGRG